MRVRLAHGVLCAALAAAGCGGSATARPAATAAQRYNGEGLRRLERGDLTGAEEMLRDALREAELVDDLQGQAEAWNNLGALASARGQLDQARAYHASALRLYGERGVRDIGEVRTRSNLGSVMLQLGDEPGATQQFEQAAALSASLGDEASGAMARIGLAAAALRRGAVADARDRAEREVSGARRRGDDGAVAAALSIEAAALEAAGSAGEAQARLAEALTIDRRREQPRAVVDDLRALARLAEARGDRAAAASWRSRAARSLRRMGETSQARDELRRAVSLLGGQGDEARRLQGELDALEATPAR